MIGQGYFVASGVMVLHKSNIGNINKPKPGAAARFLRTFAALYNRAHASKYKVILLLLPIKTNSFFPSGNEAFYFSKQL